MYNIPDSDLQKQQEEPSKNTNDTESPEASSIQKYHKETSEKAHQNESSETDQQHCLEDESPKIMDTWQRGQSKESSNPDLCLNKSSSLDQHRKVLQSSSLKTRSRQNVNEEFQKIDSIQKYVLTELSSRNVLKVNKDESAENCQRTRKLSPRNVVDREEQRIDKPGAKKSATLEVSLYKTNLLDTFGIVNFFHNSYNRNLCTGTYFPLVTVQVNFKLKIDFYIFPASLDISGNQFITDGKILNEKAQDKNYFTSFTPDPKSYLKTTFPTLDKEVFTLSHPKDICDISPQTFQTKGMLDLNMLDNLESCKNNHFSYILIYHFISFVVT